MSVILQVRCYPRAIYQNEVGVGSNPFLGVVFHWIGGLASASCYLPFRGIRRWSWEIY